MTIKIVKEEPDPSVIKRVVCNRCGVTLEYLPIDIKTIGLTCMGESDGSLDYIDCLKCNNRITVKRNR